MSTLFEAGVEIILLIILIRSFQALLEGFGLVVGGVSIHGTHAINTVYPLRPEVYDEEIPLQIYLVI